MLQKNIKENVVSEYIVKECDFKDEQMLVDALKQMGYKPAVHDEAVEIQTYYNRGVKPKAHIVIDKSQFRGYGAVGFERQEKGYKVHMDNGDLHKFKFNKLKQSYSEATIMKTVRSRSRFSVKSRQEKEGQIHIRLRRNY